MERSHDLVHASPLTSDPPDETYEAMGEEIRYLSLAELEANPNQPRRQFEADELTKMALSIATHGVISPIVVRATETGWQIVAGERRFRAAQEAGLTHIPARMVEVGDQQAAELALVENIQRQDLNAIEKAAAFEAYINQYGVTHEELATQLGLDRSTVTNLIRLLELPEAIREAVRAGQITYGHARALLSLNDATEQIALSRKIMAEALSVRQTEAMVKVGREASGRAGRGESRKVAKSNHLLSIENEVRQLLGAKVEIKPKDKQKGSITIHFETNDDFERVIKVLTGR